MGVIALAAARLAWEVLDPVRPHEFKGLLYARDAVLLVPAGILAACSARAWPAGRAERLGAAVRAIHHRLGLRFGGALLLVAAAALLAAAALRCLAFRSLPLIVDEAAYLFQAQTYAAGALSRSVPELAAPALTSSVTHVQDGRMFSVFFPLWPLLLAPFVTLGVPGLLPVLVGAALVVLTGWLGALVADRARGVGAAALLASSPFFLLQSASLFGHGLAAVLVLLGVLATLRLSGAKRGLAVGALAGMLLLHRPLTGLLLELWFLASCLLFERPRGLASFARTAAATLPGLAAGALALGVYDHALTGDALLTPHDAVLPGMLGPGLHVLRNAAVHVAGLAVDGGVLPVAVLGLAVAGLRLRPSRTAWMLALLVVSNLGLYSLYRYHGFSYGPRFCFDTFPVLVVLAIRGVDGLLAAARAERTAMAGRLAWLAATGLLLLTPAALGSKLLSFRLRADLLAGSELAARQVEVPAFVFLVGGAAAPARPERIEPVTGGMFRNDVQLAGPVIFGNHRTDLAAQVHAAFPQRRIYAFALDRGQLLPLAPRAEPAGVPVEAAARKGG